MIRQFDLYPNLATRGWSVVQLDHPITKASSHVVRVIALEDIRPLLERCKGYVENDMLIMNGVKANELLKELSALLAETEEK